MTQLAPYLSFDGTCAEAMKFYAQLLGAKVEALITYAEVPGGDKPPPSHANKIMHAYLVHKDFALMGGDSTPEMPYAPIEGVMLALSLESNAEAERVFAALAEGGQVQMPLAETFWAERFGMLKDRYGVPWGINGKQKPMA